MYPKISDIRPAHITWAVFTVTTFYLPLKNSRNDAALIVFDTFFHGWFNLKPTASSQNLMVLGFAHLNNWLSLGLCLFWGRQKTIQY